MYSFFKYTRLVLEKRPGRHSKLDKEKSTELIDGAVVFVLALSWAIRNDNRASMYDERGMLRCE